MTRDDVIRMAREAGWIIRDDLHYMDHQAMQDALVERIERFAALVAAAERTRLHDKFMQIHKSQQHSNNYWHFAARKIKEEA